MEREFSQLMTQGIHRVIPQPADLAAAILLNRQRLQDVVHLIGVEIQPRRFARAQRSLAFKKADAVFVKRDPAYRQIRR